VKVCIIPQISLKGLGRGPQLKRAAKIFERLEKGQKTKTTNGIDVRFWRWINFRSSY